MKIIVESLKRLPPLFYIIMPYINLFFIDINTANSQEAPSLGLPEEITLLTFGINLIWPFLLRSFGMNGKKILFWAMIMKLFYIPVFIINFVLGLIGLLSIHLVFVAIMMFIYDVALMIPSGLYVLSGVLKAKNEGKLKTTETVLCIILQFIFVLDVIASIYAFVKTRSREKNAEQQEN